MGKGWEKGKGKTIKRDREEKKKGYNKTEPGKKKEEAPPESAMVKNDGSGTTSSRILPRGRP